MKLYILAEKISWQIEEYSLHILCILPQYSHHIFSSFKTRNVERQKKPFKPFELEEKTTKPHFYNPNINRFLGCNTSYMLATILYFLFFQNIKSKGACKKGII